MAVSATFRSALSRGFVHATQQARWPRLLADRASGTRCCSFAVRASAFSASVASAPTSVSPRTSTARRSATAASTGSARNAPYARRLARPVPWDPPIWLAEVR